MIYMTTETVFSEIETLCYKVSLYFSQEITSCIPAYTAYSLFYQVSKMVD